MPTRQTELAGILESVEPVTSVTIDTAAGMITATATARDGNVVHVDVANVPSFVVALDRVLDVPGRGPLDMDRRSDRSVPRGLFGRGPVGPGTG